MQHSLVDQPQAEGTFPVQCIYLSNSVAAVVLSYAIDHVPPDTGRACKIYGLIVQSANPPPSQARIAFSMRSVLGTGGGGGGMGVGLVSKINILLSASVRLMSPSCPSPHH